MFDTIKEEVGIVLPRKSRMMINDDLAMILVGSKFVVQNNNSSQHIVAKGRRGTTLQKTLPLAYIYCDIIEPSFVGDTKVQLLRTVNVDLSSNATVTHILQNQSIFHFKRNTLTQSRSI